MNYATFMNWAENIIRGANYLGEWLSTPIQVGNTTIAPIILISVSGLILFVGIALIKWVIS